MDNVDNKKIRRSDLPVKHLTSRLGDFLKDIKIEDAAESVVEDAAEKKKEVDSKIGEAALRPTNLDIDSLYSEFDNEKERYLASRKPADFKKQEAREGERQATKELRERREDSATRHFAGTPVGRRAIELNKPKEPQVERTPDMEFERAVDRLEFAYKKHREDYLIGGSIELLMNGDFSVDLGKFAAEGLRFYEANRISAESNRPALWKTIEKQIGSSEKYTDAKEVEHEAIMTALADGVYVEPSSPENPAPYFPALPIRKDHEKLKIFMTEYGIDFDSKNAREASYEGFSNIIDALKDGRKSQEQEFEELDWYFNEFNYKEHLDEFMNKMDATREKSDDEWSKKLDQFLASRPEFNAESPEERQAETMRQLADAEEIDIDEFLEAAEAAVVFPELDPRKPRAPYERWERENKPKNYNGERRRKKLAQEISEHIRPLDPDMNLYYKNITDKNGNPSDYILVRFGFGGSNFVIAESIDNASNAMYVWHGQTGEDREGWREAFRNSKQDARSRDDVRALYHRPAFKTKGLNGLDNCWNRAWEHINEVIDSIRIKENQTA